jgi:hypothetical protein
MRRGTGTGARGCSRRSDRAAPYAEPVLTVPEAQARVDEWERRNGHPAEHAWMALTYQWKSGLDARLTSERVEDGARRWLDLCAAERRERVQRDLADTERSEAFAEEVVEAMRRADARDGR